MRGRSRAAGSTRPARSAARCVGPTSRARGSGGHEQPDPLTLRIVGRELTDDAAAKHHEHPVREIEDLVELCRDEQNADALIPPLDDLLVDELDASDIE